MTTDLDLDHERHHLLDLEMKITLGVCKMREADGMPDGWYWYYENDDWITHYGPFKTRLMANRELAAWISATLPGIG